MERHYGIDTTGLIELDILQIPYSNVRHGVRYEAVPYATLKRIFQLLPLDYRHYVFVDLGSGKGRALFVAAEVGFKKVLGAEFSPELHRAAEQNLAYYILRTGRTPNVELLCQDATSLVLPLEPIVLYLYNPFDETLMANVANEFLVSLSSHPRPAVLVYYNPAYRHLFEADGQMRLLHYERLRDQCSGKPLGKLALYANALSGL